jgi:hypothetical protein
VSNDEMIEAAAQALRAVVANRSGRGRAWQDLPERLREEYRAEATAALRAAGVLDSELPPPLPLVEEVEAEIERRYPGVQERMRRRRA